ncbi:MAG: hypothetical protein AB1689_02215 [Thermodesulfobacteriota bacterium]
MPVIWIVVTLLLATLGCSTVRVHRVEPWKEKSLLGSDAGDADAEGIRYWMSAPYLLVRKPVEVKRDEGIYAYVDGEFQRVSFDERLSVEESRPSMTPSAAADPRAGDDKPAPPTGDIAVVWMPDYCQQYRATQFNFLATNRLEMKFTGGSQLDSFNGEVDSTEVAGKLLDFMGSIAGTVAEAAAPKPMGPAPERAPLRVTEPTPSSRLRWKCARVWSLRPNLYPLVKYDGKWPDQVTAENCKSLPVLSFDKLTERGSLVESLVCDPKPIGEASGGSTRGP